MGRLHATRADPDHVPSCRRHGDTADTGVAAPRRDDCGCRHGAPSHLWWVCLVVVARDAATGEGHRRRLCGCGGSWRVGPARRPQDLRSASVPTVVRPAPCTTRKTLQTYTPARSPPRHLPGCARPATARPCSAEWDRAGPAAAPHSPCPPDDPSWACARMRLSCPATLNSRLGVVNAHPDGQGHEEGKVHNKTR